jgi:hypothetical protein
VLPSEPQPLRARFAETVRLYRASLTRCMPFMLLAALPTAAANIYLAQRVHGLGLGAESELSNVDFTRLQPVMSFLRSPAILLMYGGALACGLLGFGATLVLQQALLSGRTVAAAASLRRSLQRLPAAVLATLVTTAATLIGALLLIVPGVYISGLLQQWPAVMYGEDTGAWRALDRSARLVSGQWWYATSALLGPLSIILVLWLLCDLSPGTVGSELLSALATLVSLPLLTAALLVTHADLEQRRAGRAAREGALRAAVR